MSLENNEELICGLLSLVFFIFHPGDSSRLQNLSNPSSRALLLVLGCRRTLSQMSLGPWPPKTGISQCHFPQEATLQSAGYRLNRRHDSALITLQRVQIP